MGLNTLFTDKFERMHSKILIKFQKDNVFRYYGWLSELILYKSLIIDFICKLKASFEYYSLYIELKWILN